MVTPQDFIHRLKSQNYILNKQYHVKVLLKRFYLNSHSIVTLQDFAHRLKRQNHQCQKGGKLLLRDHDAKGTFGISFASSLIFFLAGWGAALSARIPSAVSHQTRPRTGPDQRYLDVKSAVIVQKSLYCLRIRSTLGCLVRSPLHCDRALPISRDVFKKQPSQEESRHSGIPNFNSNLKKKKCLSWRGPRKGERFFITLFFNADTFLQEKADSETGGNRRSTLHRLAESQQC